jgi:hypothetical protein
VRLADAGFAGDGHDTATAFHGVLELCP